MKSALALLGLLLTSSICFADASQSDKAKEANELFARNQLVKSALRDVATGEEVMFADTEKYVACKDQTCAEVLGVKFPDEIEVTVKVKDETSFIGEARHKSGSSTFRWDSSKWGLELQKNDGLTDEQFALLPSALRKKLSEARLERVLRDFAAAQEAHFIDNEAYVSCENADCGKTLGLALPEDVRISFQATEQSFSGRASTVDGAHSIAWDSSDGGLQTR